jgi:mono/diheme cytochrome c family protein
MIASVAVVLIFLTIGLTVVFMAFSGGPAGARERLHSQTAGGRQVAFTVTGVVIALFGIGVPVIVIARDSDTKSRSAPGGLELNSAQTNGRQVFAKNCSTCHTLDAANAVGKVGPNLDVLRPPAALVLNAINEGRARGNGQMPAELVDGKDATDVAAFVAAVAGR